MDKDNLDAFGVIPISHNSHVSGVQVGNTPAFFPVVEGDDFLTLQQTYENRPKEFASLLEKPRKHITDVLEAQGIDTANINGCVVLKDSAQLQKAMNALELPEEVQSAILKKQNDSIESLEWSRKIEREKKINALDKLLVELGCPEEMRVRIVAEVKQMPTTQDPSKRSMGEWGSKENASSTRIGGL